MENLVALYDSFKNDPEDAAVIADVNRIINTTGASAAVDFAFDQDTFLREAIIVAMAKDGLCKIVNRDVHV